MGGFPAGFHLEKGAPLLKKGNKEKCLESFVRDSQLILKFLSPGKPPVTLASLWPVELMGVLRHLPFVTVQLWPACALRVLCGQLSALELDPLLQK